MRKQGTANGDQQDGEQGFMLLGLIVAIAIILFVLGEAASKTAFTLRREREVESARRADQYVRAIRRFYLKNHSYPGSLDQLQKTNNIRYLRQLYFDPLTGKQDYRLIVVGQNKTTVKGFFGEPLAGLSSTGPGGSMGGSTDASGGTAGTAAAGATGAAATGATSPGGSTGLSGPASTFGASGTAGTLGSTGGLGSPGTPGSSSQEPGSQTGGGPGSSLGPIMGVGSSATGNSILSVNGETTYQTWEFLYDPRIEKLKAAAALNAGASSTGAGAGQTSNPFGPSGTTGATSPTTTTGGAGSSGGATPNGATPGTGP